MNTFKIRNVSLVNQDLHFEFTSQSEQNINVHLVLSADSEEIAFYDHMVLLGNQKDEIIMPINEVIQGKQLKIHYISHENSILLYSKLWPKVSNQYNYSMVKWMSRVQKQSREYVKAFIIAGNQILDEVGGAK